jgi:broad specificity phosphatase PhoE
MGTRVLLVEASPTPWDLEDRLVGNSSLPLTAEGIDALRHRLDAVQGKIEAIYRPAGNEACSQAGQILAKKYGVRARDNPDLNEMGLGLWQGLLPDEIRRRFPSVYSRWLQDPLGVKPPDGEPLQGAIHRIGSALSKILRRNRNFAVALALRPIAMQIARGTLRQESAAQIASHLHERQPMETIDLNDSN